MSPEREQATRQVALLDLTNIIDSAVRLREVVEAGSLDEETFSGIRDVREKIIHL